MFCCRHGTMQRCIVMLANLNGTDYYMKLQLTVFDSNDMNSFKSEKVTAINRKCDSIPLPHLVLHLPDTHCHTNQHCGIRFCITLSWKPNYSSDRSISIKHQPNSGWWSNFDDIFPFDDSSLCCACVAISLSCGATIPDCSQCRPREISSWNYNQGQVRHEVIFMYNK